MPRDFKPGWVYFFNEGLKKEFALHKETGWVYCEDGVKYSPEEIGIMHNAGGGFCPAVHNIKLTFKGEIITVTDTPGSGPAPPQLEDEKKEPVINQGELEIW